MPRSSRRWTTDAPAHGGVLWRIPLAYAAEVSSDPTSKNEPVGGSTARDLRAASPPAIQGRDRRGLLIVGALILLLAAGFFAFVAISQVVAITNASELSDVSAGESAADPGVSATD